MRERLIELILECEKENDVLNCYNERPRKIQAAEIIADYLLENGVVVLPCKVGQKVWILMLWRNPDEIGKTVFLTREEAERALKGGASDDR